MPGREPRTTCRGDSDHTEACEQPRKPKPAPKPKPSSGKLEAAESHLETLSKDYDARMKALADWEAKLARERRELEKQKSDDIDNAQTVVEHERRAYDTAIRQWRKSKTEG